MVPLPALTMDDLRAFLHSIIIRLQALHPLILTAVATLIYWLILSYYNNEARKLRQFPTVGSSLPILSRVDAFKYTKHAHNIVTTGMQKWPGRIFKIPVPSGWYVVITDPTCIEDIRKAPDHILSARKPFEEILQIQYTFSRQIIENTYHIPIIRTRLTRALPALIPSVHDEVVAACNRYLPVKYEWSSVIALENMRTIIAHASNRIFVGPTLCRNPDWIKLHTKNAINVVKTGFILRLCPPILRPFVNYFVSRKVAQRNRDGLKLLGPAIAAARRNEGSTEISENFLSWLMEEAKGEEREDLIIVERMFGLNFASIHTTSMAVTHALFDLVANPEYLQPLREEVEEVTTREGWTKSAFDQMHKVDSFIKESQRLHPAASLLMRRYTLDNFTFSDGTTIPAGTVMAVASKSVHLDPDTYEDPLTFDGYRFLKMKEQSALDGRPNKKFAMVTVHAESIAFGQGRHACPGRFFASSEIKLLLAHIIMTYDVKVDVNWPDKLYFRKRQ